MYWNFGVSGMTLDRIEINRNMRCIEIGFGIVKKWEVED